MCLGGASGGGNRDVSGQTMSEWKMREYARQMMARSGSHLHYSACMGSCRCDVFSDGLVVAGGEEPFSRGHHGSCVSVGRRGMAQEVDVTLARDVKAVSGLAGQM